LEELRLRKLSDIVARIQAVYRAYKIRKYYLELRAASLGIFQGKKDRKRKSVNQKFYGDYLALNDNPKVKPILSKFGDARVLFSSVVKKVNASLKLQERILMITDQSLYYLDPKKLSIKRKADINQANSISLSPYCDGMVVVHVKEPSYAFICECDKSTEIITVITNSYQQLMNTSLSINFDKKIAFKARKGQKEVNFENGNKPAIVKKAKGLIVTADAAQVAGPEAFAAVIEYSKLKSSSSQPGQRPLIIKKNKRRNA